MIRNIAPAPSGRPFAKESSCIPRRLSTAALFFALTLITNFNVICASEATVTPETNAAEDIDYAEVEVDLHELTDEELVAICTDRGFELVGEVDDGTGEPLSYAHDDYVDAAKECLRLEAEMEEFYDENPNLLGELEAEKERMMKENDELQKRLDEAQGRLASERDEAKKKKSSAFVNPEMSVDEKEQKETESAAPERSEEGAEGSDKEKEEANAALKELLNDDSDAIIDLDEEDSTSDADRAPKTEEENDISTSPDDAPHTENGEVLPQTASAGDKGVAPISTEGGSGPLATLKLAKDIALEVCDRVKRDFTYIADIVLPKPMRGPLKKLLGRAFNIAKDTSTKGADMAKRYAVAFFKSAKEAYEKRRLGEGGGENSENAATA